MDTIGRVKTKISKIEKLVSELKVELETLASANQRQPTNVQTMEILPSEMALQSEYEKLYQQFIARNFDGIRIFLKKKSARYLTSFCRANRLPLDTTKLSKDKIADEIMQWMAQREVIAKKAV
ncbi:hypothetical protein FJY63_03560 [Candidatus Sumerlaeota bacterium]|nr:hypothetical protein [Candidatus Sumerlaeota bacterium]